MSNRRFGVEIECYYGDEHDGEDTWGMTQLLNDNGFRPWTQDIHYDGSGVEVSGPVLQGEEGFAELAAVMDLIRANGGRCTTADGMHVHHEAIDFAYDQNKVIRLMESWADLEPQIHAFVAPRRRGSYACGRTITKPSVIRAKQRAENGEHVSSYIPMSRGALNMRNVASMMGMVRNGEDPREFYQPTIEIRLHEGTVDSEVAVAWVKFGQAFLDKVSRTRSRPLAVCARPGTLLNRLDLDTETKKVLLSKATNPTDLPDHPDMSGCDEYCWDNGCDCF